MKKRLVSVVLVAAFAFSMLAGCGSDNSAANDNKNNTSAEAEKTASKDGDFNLTVNFASEPMTMDPALNSSVDGAVMANHLFEGLMKWESTGEEVEGSDGTCDSAKLTYGQAESYDKTANDDGTVTYTFHLRDGIKWSDGKDVTAGDFEYAWKRLVNPATAADYNYMLDCVVNANEIMAGEKDPSELAVKAVDDKTFEVTLTTDLPYFEELCAFPAMMPVRQDIIEANGDQWTFDPSTYISNGPYKLTEWTHNSQIVMAKDENYYDYENLGPDTLTFKLMDDTNAMLSGFKSGELDYIQEAPQAELPNLIASGDMKIVDYLGTYYVCFQTQKAPFDNPKVREAFTLAVDRDFKSQNGEKECDFIDIVAWRSTGEFVSKYFTKGSMAVVSGRLQIRSWTDKEGGKRRSAEVVADNVYFGSSKRDSGSSAPAAGSYSAPAAPAANSEFSMLEDDDSDLPF